MSITRASGAIASCLVLAQMVWAYEQCRQNPSYTCRLPVSQPYPTCINTYFVPGEGSYCDSRDGECGRTQCNSYSVTVYKWVDVYTPYNGVCTFPKDTFGPTGDGICSQASLTGDQCGYCPGGSQ